ncbi:cytochrome c biogenesis protein ResB [Rhodococcus aetherivorans]|uniref:Ccs1/ResB-related putative cytochrome C-type biogenesis protein n=1 Tax=Rhodococcus aetherivorans TaxID=191292 RepID=A0A059ML24_9NOCA|nr:MULTISPECIES: cytochrome c biogenesis protein ResB [Rhodococcus]ETT23200.1 ResB family protein [Rhodococcus rhodochrous ATCC 21198]NCL75017.1 Cytochrome c biogenesis protein Ccs1 [Rhodococcus sp. YH1]ANZ24213.1 cytochrome C biogenesis protein ResB [Rhodococcus sp. WB1]KDE11919.1 cytochrome C biogenesis protein ResB [Rhodococcus aetherivorans]MDV6293759.1 cytochrome c biogenesis protein ResB [Rhodococcus aetherivorans]
MTATDTPTAPPSPTPPPRQGPAGRTAAFVRNTWRGLTSMRTALVLLFLLALAAIPGALLPQRSLNSGKVDEYIAARPTLGPLLDRLELFDVFGSFWFTAIYVLLFVSLIGCILPRCTEYYRALRTRPVPAPRNLSRLPHHLETTVDASPEEVLARVRGQLRGWRIAERGVETTAGRGARDGELTLSAEKGYLREAGNLLFHLALVGLLAAVAVGKLFGYEGQRILVANGEEFCTSSPAAFDSFRAGNTLDGTGLTPMCIRVKDFSADYLDNGQAEMFTSNIDYQAGADLATNTWRDAQLRVNHPLRVGSDRVYLQGHGFAPSFTVTWPDGETRTETLQWRPDDATTFLSSGAMRFDPPGGMYPDPDERRRNQIAIEGLFAPTAVFHGNLLSSGYPALTDPAVAIDIYKGDTGLDTGTPQSLFSLNGELINQGRLVKQDRVNLFAGESVTLPDGTQIRFDGATDFVNLQVSHDPAQTWVLVSAITMMVGLLVSLLIKRRRIWVRAYPAGTVADGERRTVVELGGLARTDQAGWGDEFERLTGRLLGDDTTARAKAAQEKKA